MMITTKEQYLLHDATVNAAKQAFILSFRHEIIEHKYDINNVIAALSIRLGELKAEEYEVDARADHNSEEQFNHE